MSVEPTSREVWLALVRSGRSKFALSLLAVMLAASVWEFARGRIGLRLAVLAIVAITYARIPAAAGIAAGLLLRRIRRR